MFTWSALLLAALLIGISKAGFGTGVAIMAPALVALAIGPEEMLGVLLPVLIVGDCLSIPYYLRKHDKRNLAMIVPGCAAGVAVGMFALEWFRHVSGGGMLLGGLVGLICLAFIVVQTLGMIRRSKTREGEGAEEVTPAVGAHDQRSGPAPAVGAHDERSAPAPAVGAHDERSAPAPAVGAHDERSGPAPAVGAHDERSVPAPYRPRFWHGLLVGTAAGLTSTLAHGAGPILAMFVMPQRLDKRLYVGTMVWYFLAGNLMKLAPFVWRGIITTETLSYLPYLAPAVLVGTLLGVWMNRRIPPRAFSVIIYVLVLVAGVKLIAGVFGV